MLKRIILILVVLACAAGGIWWLYDGKRQPSDLLTLYGNVDLDRMLAFLDREYLSPVADEEAARAAAEAMRDAIGQYVTIL